MSRTRKVSQEIREFLLRKKELKKNSICALAGVPVHYFWDLIREHSKSMPVDIIDRLIPVLEDYGFKSYGYKTKVQKDDEKRKKKAETEIKFNQIKKVIEEISVITGNPVSLITNCTRRRDILRDRQYATLINEQDIKLSSSKLGIALGGKDHATILNLKKRAIEYLQVKDILFMKFYPQIEQKFGLKTEEIINKYRSKSVNVR